MTEETQKRFHRVLLVGIGGHGKTTQTLTLGGPKLHYCLDTNAIDSLAAAGPEHELVQIDPDMDAMDLKPWTVSKGAVNAPTAERPKFYENWADDFSDRVENNFFLELGQKDGWLIIDGITTISYELMLLQQYLQRGALNYEARMDYQLAGQKMSQIMYWICRQPCHVLCTARYRNMQDELTRQVNVVLDLPGSARSVGMYSFGWVLGCEARFDSDTKPAKFLLRTVQDEDHPALRVVAARMPDRKLPAAVIPADLDFNCDLTIQGIGKWLNPK